MTLSMLLPAAANEKIKDPMMTCYKGGPVRDSRRLTELPACATCHLLPAVRCTCPHQAIARVTAGCLAQPALCCPCCPACATLPPNTPAQLTCPLPFPTFPCALAIPFCPMQNYDATGNYCPACYLYERYSEQAPGSFVATGTPAQDHFLVRHSGPTCALHRTLQ